MLTGRPPFDLPTFAQTCAELSTDRLPPSICAHLPDIPPALERAIFRCFERSVEKRTQSVAELAGALLEAAGSPFASVVRARIDATLASRTGREGAPKDSGSRIAIHSFDGLGPAGMVVASGRPPSEASRRRPARRHGNSPSYGGRDAVVGWSWPSAPRCSAVERGPLCPRRKFNRKARVLRRRAPRRRRARARLLDLRASRRRSRFRRTRRAAPTPHRNPARKCAFARVRRWCGCARSPPRRHRRRRPCPHRRPRQRSP